MNHTTSWSSHSVSHRECQRGCNELVQRGKSRKQVPCESQDNFSSWPKSCSSWTFMSWDTWGKADSHGVELWQQNSAHQNVPYFLFNCIDT